MLNSSASCHDLCVTKQTQMLATHKDMMERVLIYSFVAVVRIFGWRGDWRTKDVGSGNQSLFGGEAVDGDLGVE